MDLPSPAAWPDQDRRRDHRQTAGRRRSGGVEEPVVPAVQTGPLGDVGLRHHAGDSRQPAGSSGSEGEAIRAPWPSIASGSSGRHIARWRPGVSPDCREGAVRSSTGSPSASMGIPLPRRRLFQLNAAHVSNTTWPWSENDVKFPSASIDTVCAPAVTPTAGIPNRSASGGKRTTPLSPFVLPMTEPSGSVVIFPGPEMFEVTLFPLLRFVATTVNEPVVRMIIVPSPALRILLYSLSTGKLSPISNPQKSAGRVNGSAGRNSHCGPRASAGPAVSIPPHMPRSAPSATTIASRLIAIPPRSRLLQLSLPRIML